MNLREIRKSKGLTQTKLGEILGVSPNTITQYETGAREPNLEKIIKLSEILGVTIEQLVKAIVESKIYENNFTRLRKLNGFTQEDVAKHLGTTTATISRYENNKMEPSIKDAIKIAKLFSTTVEELFGDE